MTWAGDTDLKVTSIWMSQSHGLGEPGHSGRKCTWRSSREEAKGTGVLDKIHMCQRKTKEERCHKSLENCFKKEGIVSCITS